MKTTYACEYCGYMSDDVEACTIHENTCNHNPQVLEVTTTVKILVDDEDSTRCSKWCGHLFDNMCGLFDVSLKRYEILSVGKRKRCDKCLELAVKVKP